jgi:Flp pilus assembly pilin Flp
MSDLILRTATRSRIELRAVAHRLAESAGRAVRRFQREQTGQDMVEYAGVLLVISVIIAAVSATGVWSPLVSGIGSLINDVVGGTSGKH